MIRRSPPGSVELGAALGPRLKPGQMRTVPPKGVGLDRARIVPQRHPRRMAQHGRRVESRLRPMGPRRLGQPFARHVRPMRIAQLTLPPWMSPL